MRHNIWIGFTAAKMEPKKADDNDKNNDALRSCLIERLSLSNERDVLLAKKKEMINPKVYIECVERLEAIANMLHSIECEIQHLTALLRGKLVYQMQM
jgi:hypothetical protein